MSRKLSKMNRVFAIPDKMLDKTHSSSGLSVSDLISKLDFSSTQHGQEMNLPVESLKGLAPFLRYYQCLGILPISILPNFSGLHIKSPNPLRILSGISLFIQVCMICKGFFEFIESFVGSTKSTAKVGAINSIIYFLHIFLMSLLMLKSIKGLPSLIEAFKRVEILCKKHSESLKKNGLVLQCWILFGYFFCTQIFGNILYYYAASVKNNVTSPAEFSATFAVEKWGTLDPVGFHGYFSSIFEFYCDCIWIFGDMLTALLSFILTRYFSRLNHGINASQARSVKDVEKLRMDHRAMKDLVEECNQVFSPIILTNYMGNIGYLLTRLYTGIGEDLSHPRTIVRIESIYALVYQIAKIFVPTWFAAILHETAHFTLDTVHDWPSMIEASECKERMMVMNRFVSQLVSDPVGLSGCGYYIITKSFMVTLISGLTTYEVIILQFQQAGVQ